MTYCYNCGEATAYSAVYPVGDDLKYSWGLSEQLTRLFNQREGLICEGCGSNVRAQGLARAILQSAYGFGATSLKSWVREANRRKLAVCELNSCHELHNTLKNLERFTYAEYGTSSEQNIEKLSYKDNSFGLFLHSETLEHVDDPTRAMIECRRVITDDGLVLFTTPVIWGRKTRQRAAMRDGVIEYILPPSYHGQQTDDYLVYYEFGNDIDRLLGAKVEYADWRHQNFVFSSGKTPSRIQLLQKFRFMFLEKISQKGGV